MNEAEKAYRTIFGETVLEREVRNAVGRRNEIIEECAVTIQAYEGFSDDERRIAAFIIRALKSDTGG